MGDGCEGDGVCDVGDLDADCFARLSVRDDDDVALNPRDSIAFGTKILDLDHQRVARCDRWLPWAVHRSRLVFVRGLSVCMGGEEGDPVGFTRVETTKAVFLGGKREDVGAVSVFDLRGNQTQ